MKTNPLIAYRYLPERVEKAQEFLNMQHCCFLDFFGKQLVVFPDNSQLEKGLQAYFSTFNEFRQKETKAKPPKPPRFSKTLMKQYERKPQGAFHGRTGKGWHQGLQVS